MSEIDKYAPVLIPTLNRHVHFKRCVESLSRCTHADKTDLYIALDYPLNESHREGYNIISEYVDTISGFKNVHIVRREENFGVIKNIREARELVFESNDRIILSEDDNEFSPNFLSFINDGLSAYEHRNDIYAICGYNSPIDMPDFYKKDVYLRIGYSAWGVGIWKNKAENFYQSIEKIKHYIDDRNNANKVKTFSRSFYYMFKQMVAENKSYGDANVAMHLIMNDMFCIYPVESRVRNYGHDGSGIHCGVNDIYTNQKIYNKDVDAVFPADIKPDYKLLNYIKGKNEPSWYIILKQSIPLKWKQKIKKIISR